ncbi:MAG: flagellar motor switch protein FliN [Comamonadaceae bacterium CG_4_9_14_3_um_filter_60_33]|nr:MAG: flagellar motor switch protein FliN [Comamonadaceae bacterium CG2_30_59_20]PIY29791.1 MAG: flagellar motor switch protein FliN [Comamonadaceae bacterium CG_4_10_14_3_um_filter_60_42]PJB43644.1 MAG: flagellar motor switch protein FliN [Comamonadaceae bacterium CG_4_9_14_3_um_filter_60_33]
MTDEAINESTLVDDDIWGSALAEQAQAAPFAPLPPSDISASSASPTTADTGASLAGQRVFQPLPSAGTLDIAPGDIERVLDVPVQLTAELGRARITIKSLLQLSQGSIVELDGLAGEPMDVFINGYLIAQGEVVVVNDKFGIRLTDIVTPSERMQKLNR